MTDVNDNDRSSLGGAVPACRHLCTTILTTAVLLLNWVFVLMLMLMVEVMMTFIHLPG